ncbi:MAG: OmpA family protein [Flavobacterium sp.]|uniref:OmpA family protein n=1 Tax=Flavobacterium sp. TaxID=239 RepID=UPI0032639015
MKLRIILFISILSFVSLSAQKGKLVSAQKNYNSLAYIDAIKIFEKVANKGYGSVELFQKLGNSYYFNAKLKEAGKWYEKLFSLGQDVDAEYYYRYSQCLKAEENYVKADEYLELFTKKTNSDNRSKIFNEDKKYLESIKKNSNRYSISDAGMNSAFSDYGPSITNNKLVFASARDTGGVSKTRSKWTNQSFTNLYKSDIDAEGNLSGVEALSKKVNSKFNESTPVFTNDGKTMYFTRNNFINGKKFTDTNKIVLLKLYKATLEGDNWVNIQELPFNSNEYSVAHPALSPDNKTLYFASNMEGTVGQSDIFKVSINSDGSYGTPENLGLKINTESRETFPFVSADNILYFASDGQSGLGGLDVFAVKIYENGSYSNVLNVGSPLNGPTDDFAYIIDPNTKKGYFTSNRDGGKGFDDIYKFTENSQLEFDCKQTITGVVSDLQTTEIVPNTTVKLFDDKMNEVSQTIVDAGGKYKFENLECNKVYYVRTENEAYETAETSVKTDKFSGEKLASLPVSKKIIQVSVGSDLASAFGIKIIYFDLDKSFIRKDAAIELAKMVEVMKEYPTMKIEVKSHTDSRQTSKYNKELSEKRAKSTVAWMIENGISEDRLVGNGYGESQLINNCADGVKCSEDEHQANRRSEFIITKM